MGLRKPSVFSDNPKPNKYLRVLDYLLSVKIRLKFLGIQKNKLDFILVEV